MMSDFTEAARPEADEVDGLQQAQSASPDASAEMRDILEDLESFDVDPFQPEDVEDAISVCYDSDESDVESDDEDDVEMDTEEATDGPEVDLELRRKLSEYGFEYVTGWLCKEFAKTHPELGRPTGQLPPLGDDEERSWIRRLSRGGLREPTTELVALVREFEDLFNKFHGGLFNIDYGKDVIRRFTKVLEAKYPEIDPKILKKFSTFRLFLRIRTLERIRRAENRKRIESNRARRKKKQFVPDC